MVERYFESLDKNIPPVQFSVNLFEMENGDVAITLEKFPRARERGGRRCQEEKPAQKRKE